MNQIPRTLLLALALVLCIQPAHAQDPPEEVISRVTAAFNAHDVEGLAALMTEDIRWMSVLGDTLGVEAAGIEAFRASMTAYFANVPGARSEVEAVIANGKYLSFRERAFWQGPDGERSMASIGVYELREGKVARVWYYPAQ